MSFAAMMLVACGVDALIGWPEKLYARFGHPVSWIGAMIAGLEARCNHGRAADRLRRGTAVVAACISTVTVIAFLLQCALPGGWQGIVLGGVLAWPLMALRSMHGHVAAVAEPLVRGDLPAARRAVSMIVGRDPAQLDTAGVSRATIESLAENTSDGIVAPVFWGCVAGLPGLAAYKAINTLDSMIGHRNDRYEHFGKAAARLDDLANLVPARLTGLLFAAVSGRARTAIRVMWRDARRHRSPNAGWPEAAMAAGLGVRLSGPRIYGDRVAEEPWLNGAAPDPDSASVVRGLVLYTRAMVLLAALLAMLALV